MFNGSDGRLSDITVYLKRALKFFDMKNERFTPVVFIILLFASFSGVLIPFEEGKTDMFFYIYNIFTVFIMYMGSSAYLCGYIRELKGQPCSVGQCISFVVKHLPRILGASIIYTLGIITGTIMLIIPGIIIFISFMFYMCFIVDSGSNMKNAFIASKYITNGKKMIIFSIVFIFNIILIIPLTIVMALASSSRNIIVFQFVVAFASVIISIMQQRLTALMYYDMMYGVKR